MANQELSTWGIHAGKTGDANTLFLEKNCVAIGWPNMGDLTELKPDRKLFEERLAKSYPGMTPGAVRINTGQIFRFVNEMKTGDLVIYPSKADKMIHTGRIEGKYKYDSRETAFRHQRPVKWLKKLPRTKFTQGALYETGAAMTFFQIKTYADEFIAALQGAPPVIDEPEGETVAVISENIELTTADFIKKRLTQQAKGHPFAHFVAHLLQTMDYHTRVSPEGPDHGIDIIAHRDELGIEPPIVKVQCKSTDGSINEETVSAFYGRVAEKEFGLFVTLGTYNKSAEGYARGRSNLRLIDGDELVELILEHYESFDARFKGLLPLKRVYVPESLEEVGE